MIIVLGKFFQRFWHLHVFQFAKGLCQFFLILPHYANFLLFAALRGPFSDLLLDSLALHAIVLLDLVVERAEDALLAMLAGLGGDWDAFALVANGEVSGGRGQTGS